MSDSDNSVDPCSPCHVIRESSLEPLDLAKIKQFATTIQKANPSPFPENEVSLALQQDKDLIQLRQTIENAINIEKYYAMLPGLSEEERLQLKTLIDTRRNFKARHDKDQFNAAEITRLIENEKKLLPLDQTIQWWSANLQSFKKLDLWEKLSEKIIAEHKKIGANEETINTSLHHLTDIKNDWAKHQLFAGFTSLGLFNFYRKEVALVEKELQAILSRKKTLAPTIRDYLTYEYQLLDEMKNQIIYSILFRLISAEFYSDSRCDDVLHHLFDQIESRCGIETHSNKKSPDLRLGLNAKQINEMILSIVEYCETHPDEKIILDRLNQSSFRREPVEASSEMPLSSSPETTLIGQGYAKALLALVEQSLHELNQISMNLATKTLDEKSYEKHLRMIDNLEHFSVFYDAFQSGKTQPPLLTHLKMLKLKLQLHHELSITLTKEAGLPTLIENDTALQSLILNMTKAINTIENNQLINEETISDFIRFCNQHIFFKLSLYLNQSSRTLHETTLLALLELLLKLPTDHLKLSLIAANKNQIEENPHWLTLINHLDDKKSLSILNHHVTSHQNKKYFSKYFNETLAFSKHLTTIKHDIHEKIRGALLIASGIQHAPHANTLQETLSHASVTDKQLLQLLSLSIAKCEQLTHPAAHLKMMIVFIQKITNVLLMRTEKNAALFDKIETHFSRLHPLLQHLSENNHHRINATSLWSMRVDQSALIAPLHQLSQKILARRMIAILQQYALSKITKSHLDDFKKISNDPTFRSIENKNANTQALLKTALQLKNNQDALKIMSTLPLYHDLSRFMEDKEKMSVIHAGLARLKQTAANDPVFSTSKNYQKMVRELWLISGERPIEEKFRPLRIF